MRKSSHFWRWGWGWGWEKHSRQREQHIQRPKDRQRKSFVWLRIWKKANRTGKRRGEEGRRWGRRGKEVRTDHGREFNVYCRCSEKSLRLLRDLACFCLHFLKMTLMALWRMIGGIEKERGLGRRLLQWLRGQRQWLGPRQEVQARSGHKLYRTYVRPWKKSRVLIPRFLVWPAARKIMPFTELGVTWRGLDSEAGWESRFQFLTGKFEISMKLASGKMQEAVGPMKL